MSKQQDWMDVDGTVAERTNTVIAGVLDWADKDDIGVIRRKNVEDAIEHLTPVGSEDTIRQYVERVIENGPFYPSRAPGQWVIHWERVYGTQEETSTGEYNE